MGDGFWQMEAHDEGESDRMGERGGESKHWTGTTTIHACVMYCPGTPILPELVQPSYTHVLLWYTHNLDWYTHQPSHTHTCCSGSDTPIHWSGTLLWYTQTANINSYSGILVHWTVALESYSALVQWKSSTAKSVPSLEAVWDQLLQSIRAHYYLTAHPSNRTSTSLVCNTHSFWCFFGSLGKFALRGSLCLRSWKQEDMLFLIGLMKNLEGASVAHISRSILGLYRALAVNAPTWCGYYKKIASGCASVCMCVSSDVLVCIWWSY